MMDTAALVQLVNKRGGLATWMAYASAQVVQEQRLLLPLLHPRRKLLHLLLARLFQCQSQTPRLLLHWELVAAAAVRARLCLAMRRLRVMHSAALVQMVCRRGGHAMWMAFVNALEAQGQSQRHLQYFHLPRYRL